MGSREEQREENLRRQNRLKQSIKQREIKS